jgi:hypothetical protein
MNKNQVIDKSLQSISKWSLFLRKTAICSILLASVIAAACSSPAKVEVRPKPLVLEGKGTKGRLTALVFDENGKELDIKDHPVTWMCLDEDTIKVRQDGTVEAVKSGKALVDVEIVGSEVPGLPGTGLHGTGEVVVRIPGWIEMSGEEIFLEAGQPDVTVWAELRNDANHTMANYLPAFKIDNPNVASIVTFKNDHGTRMFAKITPKAPGETYLSAYYKDLAADILVVVSNPPKDTDVQ